MKQCDDGFMIPEMDDTFDNYAIKVLRDCMARHHRLPAEIKSLLENIAIYQQADRSTAAREISGDSK